MNVNDNLDIFVTGSLEFGTKIIVKLVYIQ